MLVLLLCSTTVLARQNQWINTGGPYKGSVISIATTSSGEMFVGTGIGIYRSPDQGQTWNLKDASLWRSHLPSIFPSSSSILVASNGSVFIRTDDSLVFRSTDNGNTWSSLASALSNAPVRAIISSSAGDLFALTDSLGILRSSDDGDQWTRMNLSLPISHIYALAVDSTSLMIIRTDTCFYTSTNMGSSWSPGACNGGLQVAIAPNRTIFAAAVAPFHMAGGTDTMVYRSIDGGAHWTACYSVAAVRGIVVVPSLYVLAVGSDGNVSFASDDAVYRSIDNGDSWKMIPWNKWSLSDRPGAISYDSENNLYVGTNQCGLFRLSVLDTAFTVVPGGFTTVTLNSIAINALGHVFATVDSGVFRSTDNGQDWTKVLGPYFQNPTFKVFAARINSQGSIFALKSIQGGTGYLFRSSDEGAHWDSLGNRGTTLGVGPGGLILQGWSGGASPTNVSTDNGDSWTQFSGKDTGGNYVDPYCFAFNSRNEVFAGGFFNAGWGGAWRSLDSGNTWQNVSEGLPGFGALTSNVLWPGVNLLAIDPTGILFASTDSGFFRSTNDGASWKEIDQSLPLSFIRWGSPSGPGPLVAYYGIPNIRSIAFNSAGQVYVGYDRGVYFSTDNGDTWTPFIQNAATNYSVTALAFDPEGFLYGGGNGTIYRSTITTSVPTMREGHPRSWNLGQNYPNPFNPTTQIQYSVPLRGYVSLKVYNLLGQEIATLIDGIQQAGDHKATFDGTGLASGVYFYRLRTGSFVETKKLVLLR